MADDRDQPSTAVLRPDEGALVGASDLERSLRRIVRSEIRRSLPRLIEGASLRLGHDEEIAGLIHLLAARSNDAKDEVLRKALTFYGFAMDARENGNKVVIVGPDDEIIHDVLGFESVVG